MINPKFENIAPIVLSAAQKTRLRTGIATYGYDWKHTNFGWLKELLKTELRKLQSDRCCYCRRILRFDKGPVEIEHVVNKARNGDYAHFTFELRNLALSCKDCNNGKGQKKVLRVALAAGSAYPAAAANFLWVHPYYHTYSDHILIHEAWLYEAKGGSPEGVEVITKCKLAELWDKERRNRQALIESAESLPAALRKAVGMVEEVGLDELCKELGPMLVTLMGSGGNVAKAESVLRSAHAKIQEIANDALAVP